jgi:hypothetical protein
MAVLWLWKVQFSERTFVLKSPPIANLQNVKNQLIKKASPGPKGVNKKLQEFIEKHEIQRLPWPEPTHDQGIRSSSRND